MAKYAYDGLNRRVTKGVYVSGSLDHNEDAYFNENWQILEVRKTVSGTINTNPLEQYVWHPFYIDAPVLRDYDATTSGSPTRYYYAFDANYNVTAATSSAGSPAERYYYSPYGNLIFLDGSFTALAIQQSQIGNAIAYTGRPYDAQSGLCLYRNRYYHATLGLFVSRDPIDYTGGTLNLYEYVKDRPTAAVDPFGHCGCVFSGRTCCGLFQDANRGMTGGATICCQGQLVTCVLSITGPGGPTYNSTSGGFIVRDCMDDHEVCHTKQTTTTLPCPQNCNDVSLQKSTNLQTKDSNECQCYIAEMDCLLRDLPLCSGDEVCINDVQKRAHFICMSAGGQKQPAWAE